MHPINVLFQRLVIGAARALKGSDEIVATVERLGCKHDGVATKRDDLTPNPLEILAALLSVRKDVHGIPRRHGTDLLETTPRLHATLGGARRKLVG